jgi:hypothetical protein
MIPADDTFNGTFPFRPRFTQAPGFQMHYVDEGEGEPIVCLHGEPTWAYLYRHFIPPLSKRHRVIVPDHMGFGRSETPVDREYTLGTHVDNLEALLLELDLRDVTLRPQVDAATMALFSSSDSLSLNRMDSEAARSIGPWTVWPLTTDNSVDISHNPSAR